MKSFNEWMKERSNIADYTPGFIRKPLQNLGLMGKTTGELDDANNARLDKLDRAREQEKMRRKEIENINRKKQQEEEIKKKDAWIRQGSNAPGMVYDRKKMQWVPVSNRHTFDGGDSYRRAYDV